MPNMCVNSLNFLLISLMSWFDLHKPMDWHGEVKSRVPLQVANSSNCLRITCPSDEPLIVSMPPFFFMSIRVHDNVVEPTPSNFWILILTLSVVEVYYMQNIDLKSNRILDFFLLLSFSENWLKSNYLALLWLASSSCVLKIQANHPKDIANSIFFVLFLV